MEINKENKSDLRFEQEDDAVWVFSGDSHQGTEISHLITSHIDDYNEDDVRLICHYAANEIDRLRAKLAKATPEGFVLVDKSHTENWYLDDYEGLYIDEPDNFLSEIDIGDVQKVEHKEYLITKSEVLYATKVWDDENQDLGTWEFFKNKEEADKAAVYCKAKFDGEAQEQSYE